MQFTFYLFALTFIVCALAAPLGAPDKRQIGNIACNIARFKTVGSLALASAAVQKVSSAASSDTTAAGAASTASSGLQSAKAGIAVIAGNILTGQKASATARDQVLNGLTAAKSALGNITSTDPAVMSAAAAAATKVGTTIAAGEQVVANC